ncbi:DUF4255 domain-containing protein [Kibdelosporangium aridum]|uniref:DUF4255 domain-containing protein n=1 Tax=Kibdelosporangium aridum TaxID=2030 RepID=A0A428ZID2_KIBAR|nr:DUF4255 domain-containing protein [Kibdelosporangium aridum]RSM87839.1 DUF4255 domain-containing protein [Kibdelosporangium aridum]
MSNYLAIAQATQALCEFIARCLQADGLELGAQVVPRKPPAEPPQEPLVTVFLYQTTPNGALRNRDAPTRGPDGTLLTKPQAALDLHYLISAYGNEDELEPQRLLGSIVRGLHEEPILSQVDIEEAATRPFLAGGDLAAAEQRVRFTPSKLDLDDMSKLWSMLVQTPYAFSVVYEATAVLLDGHGTPAAGKPVLSRNIRAIAGRRPVVDRVRSRPRGSTALPVEGPVPADHEVWLEGRTLAGPDVSVRVGGQRVVPDQVADNRIVFVLPEDLPAGVYPVRVDIGPIESASVPVTRQPKIVEPIEVGGVPLAVTVQLDMPIRADQRVDLLLDELDPPADRPAASYRIAAPFPLDPGNSVRIPIAAVQPLGYLVRVQVSGVVSRPGDDLRTPKIDVEG